MQAFHLQWQLSGSDQQLRERLGMKRGVQEVRLLPAWKHQEFGVLLINTKSLTRLTSSVVVLVLAKRQFLPKRRGFLLVPLLGNDRLL